MRGEESGLPLLNLGLGGFAFSFAGAVLAIGVSNLFTFEGEYWVVFSAIGATLVSVWGWLYWVNAVSKPDTDAGGKNLEQGRSS